MTGGFRLVEPPDRRGQNSSMDKLQKRPAREPLPLARRELKRCRPSLEKYEFCKALTKRNNLLAASIPILMGEAGKIGGKNYNQTIKKERKNQK
ncbi:MAG: hypothetical protein ACQEQO_05140 [Thermodesulfobacteriota bacterium]